MLIVHIFSLHIDNGSFSAYISESNQIFTNCWDLSANSPHQELIYSPDNKTWGSIFVSELLFHMTFFGQPGLSSWKRWSELDASAEASGCSPLWVETGNLHLATRLSSFFLEFQLTLLGGTVRLVNVRLSAPRLEKVMLSILGCLHRIILVKYHYFWRNMADEGSDLVSI